MKIGTCNRVSQNLAKCCMLPFTNFRRQSMTGTESHTCGTLDSNVPHSEFTKTLSFGIVYVLWFLPFHTEVLPDGALSIAMIWRYSF